MSLSDMLNIGARIASVPSIIPGTTIVSTSNGATTADGITIDRRRTGVGHYYSCKSILEVQFAGNSSNYTATVSLNFQHSSDGTSWDSISTGTVPSVVFGATSAGSTEATTSGGVYGVVEQSVNLASARRYIRVQVPVPTFTSCSSSNNLTVAGLLVFTADTLPAATPSTW